MHSIFGKRLQEMSILYRKKNVYCTNDTETDEYFSLLYWLSLTSDTEMGTSQINFNFH